MALRVQEPLTFDSAVSLQRFRCRCRGVHSMEAWTQPASWKKQGGGRKSCNFLWHLGEERL